MNRYSIISSLVALALCVGLAAWIKSCQREPLEFQSIEECKRALESRGFYCVPVKTKFTPTMVVSEKPISAEAAAEFALRLGGKDQTGKAVVFQGSIISHTYEHSSSWGKVTVIGDALLIAKIEGS